MSIKNYITIDDLTYRPIRNAIDQITATSGSLAEFDNLVDRCNDFYEDIAMQARVSANDIQYPIPFMAKEFLNYWATYKYASENKGQVQSDAYGRNVYEIMEGNAYKYYRDHKLMMTTQYISGKADSTNRYSVSFGDMSHG